MSMQNTVFAQNGRTPEQNRTITAHRKELMSRISSGLRMARTRKDEVAEKALNILEERTRSVMNGPVLAYKTERNLLRNLNDEVKSIVELEKSAKAVPVFHPARPGAVQAAIDEQYFASLTALQRIIHSAENPEAIKSLGSLYDDIVRTKNKRRHEPDQQAVSTQLIDIVERAKKIAGLEPDWKMR